MSVMRVKSTVGTYIHTSTLPHIYPVQLSTYSALLWMDRWIDVYRFDMGEREGGKEGCEEGYTWVDQTGILYVL